MLLDIIQVIIGLSTAIFFVVIDALTIAIIFAPTLMEKKGFSLTPRFKAALFTSVIVQLVGAGFIVVNQIVAPSPIIHTPNKPRGEMTSEVYDLFNKAREQFSLGNNPAALNKITDAIERDPENYILYVNRSVMYMQANKNMEAREDLLKGIELYKNMGDQQRRREKAYQIQLINQYIVLMSATKDYKKATTYYEDNLEIINDTTDTILRIYNNIGNVYLSNQKWSEASIAYEKALNLSKSLGIQEMQVITSMNLSNSNYWIAGKTDDAAKYAQLALDYLEAFDDIGVEMKNELYAGSSNALGLALLKQYDLGNKNIEFDKIQGIYSKAIDKIKGHSERSDSAHLQLSNLYANRADIYIRQKNAELAEQDLSIALNRFINRTYSDGIARQLVGYIQLKKLSNDFNWKEIYALAYAAVKLGTDVPLVQQQENQLLLEEARKELKEQEITAINANITPLLASATGTQSDNWKQFFH